MFPQYKDCVLESGLRDESSRGEYTTADREWRIHCSAYIEWGIHCVHHKERGEYTMYTVQLKESGEYTVQHT